MYCKKCGRLIENDEKYCMNCGSKVEPVMESEDKHICKICHKEYTSSLQSCPNCDTGIIVDYSDLNCPACGFLSEEGEKFCIKCGTPLVKCSNVVTMSDTKTTLQQEICKVMSSNKVTAFILKSFLLFLLPYPIYALMGRIDAFNEIYGFVSNFTIVLYFAYNLGLLAAFANGRFYSLFIALGLRTLNSLILVFQASSPWPSLFRIAVILISFIFLYVKLMSDSQRDMLAKPFNSQTARCEKCGAIMKAGDQYCPKCGNKN